MSNTYSYLSDSKSSFKLKDKYQSAGKNELPGSTTDQKEDTEEKRERKMESVKKEDQKNQNGKIV